MSEQRDNRETIQGSEPTVEHDNREIPPAVKPSGYEGPTYGAQKSWIQGTNLLIVVLAIIFIAIIIIYFVTR